MALAQQCGDAIPTEAERGFYMTPMAQGIRVAVTAELAGLGAHKHQGLKGGDTAMLTPRRALVAELVAALMAALPARRRSRPDLANPR